MNKAIILLSGGLDSYVALDITNKLYNIKLALTFDYGQEAFKDELEASSKMCKIYGIEQKIINLPYLEEIKGNDVWIPNRNGLFINIAACFCDSFGFKAIIFGANKEEAREFPDNTKEFVQKTNETLEYSTKSYVKAMSPIIDMNKKQIVKYALDNNLDFSLIKSCYNKSKNKKHCGKCPSCAKLKNALISLKREDILFKMGF